MHRIDVPSATVDYQFTEGSPSGGVSATSVSAEWLNDLQENIAKVVEGAGLPLTKGRANDLLDSIGALTLSFMGVGGSTLNDFFTFPFRDKTTGVKRNLIVQIGSAQNSVLSLAYTLPIAFPNAGFLAVAGQVSSVGAANINYSTDLSLTQIIINKDQAVTSTHAWIAFGY